ncbi:hypothetical protein WG906_12260 [Pedobacter sp. P351]|uniref:hypothetical protein n=1 Tax=Pedobacter superstes TaxID=3133441 RepID=UPI0030AC6C96
MKEARPNNISKFELRSDSSAIISFVNSTSQREITGTWSQNIDKEMGNHNRVEFTSDVVIKFMANDAMEIMAFVLKFNKGRVTLNGTDMVYEKQN